MQAIVKLKNIVFHRFTRLLATGTVVFSIITLVAFHVAYRDRIFPGVTILGSPVGNQSITQASRILKRQFPISPNQKLTLFLDHQEWEIVLSQIGLEYDFDQTARQAFHFGRTGYWLEDAQAKKQAWFSGVNLDLAFQLNQDSLEKEIAAIATQVYHPTIEPQIEIDDQTVIIKQGMAGQEVDQRQLISFLKSHFQKYQFDPVRLPVIRRSPLLTDFQIEATRLRAQKFLNQKLEFTYQEKSWEWSGHELVDLISFDQSLNEEKLTQQVTQLSMAISHPAQNAAFQFENGKVVQFRPEIKGTELNQDETIRLIKSTLEEIEKTNSQEPTSKIIPLPVNTISPDITIDQVNSLGIQTLLGRGLSYFTGSIASRVHNLTLASTNLNGILIPPGETFSLNQTLGEVSPATGFQSAFVIKEGRTILDDGGGVCQVSTTLFRAALDAGLPIIERHPHSYRVSYYEQGGFGPGLDATVWIPSVDLKFKNDTPAYLLIQTHVNNTTKALTYDFYGTDDGRQVTLSKPKIWNQTSPPPELYQDDPTLPLGTVKQIERAIPGAKVSVDWQVTRDGQILQERTFFSQYQPWQAVYLRGTGPVP